MSPPAILEGALLAQAAGFVVHFQRGKRASEPCWFSRSKEFERPYVNDVLYKFATQTITQKLRTHTLALELERLDKMQQVFERQARAGDVQSAHLVTKLIERR